MRQHVRTGLGIALALASLAGCGGRHTKSAPAADLQSRSQALIDAGNQAYGAGDYDLAARRYAAAAVTKKDDPAAYYGLGMALSKLGRDEEARAAYERARKLVHQQRSETAGP